MHNVDPAAKLALLLSNTTASIPTLRTSLMLSPFASGTYLEQ